MCKFACECGGACACFKILDKSFPLVRNNHIASELSYLWQKAERWELFSHFMVHCPAALKSSLLKPPGWIGSSFRKQMFYFDAVKNVLLTLYEFSNWIWNFKDLHKDITLLKDHGQLMFGQKSLHVYSSGLSWKEKRKKASKLFYHSDSDTG